MGSDTPVDDWRFGEKGAILGAPKKILNNLQEVI